MFQISHGYKFYKLNKKYPRIGAARLSFRAMFQISRTDRACCEAAQLELELELELEQQLS